MTSIVETMDVTLYIVLLIITSLVCFRYVRKYHLLDPSGRVVFISGCDSGIGLRLAVFFHDLGCEVIAGCLRPNDAVGTLPEGVITLPLDVTSESSVKAAVERVKEELRKCSKDLWAVINNAGVCIYGEFDWLTMDHCRSQVEVNLLGTVRVTKRFLPIIRRAKGRIVTITSVNGSVAYPGLAVYCATKFGLEGFSDSLRREMTKYGVYVTVVQPGDFARLTNIMAAHKERVKEMWDDMDEEDRKFYDSYFHRYNEIVLKNYGITSPKNFESSPLLDDVKKAVLSPRPAARYQSAPLHFRLFFTLLSLLPVSMADALLVMLFKNVFASK